ncbi:MAG TPA: hypothetical protein VGA98_09315 [Allosphingosinicella sp.]
MILSLILLAGVAAAGGEAPFEPSRRSFADPAACEAFLAGHAGDARGKGFDAVEGPYRIGAGDVRIHIVRTEGSGHRIDEQRCLGAALSGRSWHHSLGDEDEEAFTAESAARSAPWLKKGPGGR